MPSITENTDILINSSNNISQLLSSYSTTLLGSVCGWCTIYSPTVSYFQCGSP